MIVPTLLAACAAPIAPLPEPSAERPDRPPLVIAHLADAHGRLEPEIAPWLPGRPAIGGFEAVAARVSAWREEGPLLLLDAGDRVFGGPLSRVPGAGVPHGAALEALEVLGADAWTPGVHDLAGGLEAWRALAQASPVPILAANLRVEGEPPGPGWRLLERDGWRVLVVGVVTPDLPDELDPATAAALSVDEPAEAVRRVVADHGGDADLVVALSHLGLEGDRALAAEVPALDLVLGGRDHRRMEAAERVGDTWIAHPGSYRRTLGRAVVDPDGNLAWEPADLVQEGASAPAAAAAAARWREALADLDARVVGRARDEMRGLLHQESVLGRWTADRVREAADADVALVAPFGLDGRIPEGEVTLGDLARLYPYDLRILTFTVTGEELATILRRNVTVELTRRGFPLQLSGVVVRWKADAEGPGILEVRVGGRPLDPAGTYRVATHEAHLPRWDTLFHVPRRPVTFAATTVLDAAVAAFEAGLVHPPWEPRSVRTTGG